MHSWHHCCNTKSTGFGHTIPIYYLGSSCTLAVALNEQLASIFRVFPEATQRKHPIMNNKQKDPMTLLCDSGSFPSPQTDMWLLPRDCVRVEGKEKHTDATLQYSMYREEGYEYKSYKLEPAPLTSWMTIQTTPLLSQPGSCMKLAFLPVNTTQQLCCPERQSRILKGSKHPTEHPRRHQSCVRRTEILSQTQSNGLSNACAYTVNVSPNFWFGFLHHNHRAAASCFPGRGLS